jgi:ribosome maturation factor RimP
MRGHLALFLLVKFEKMSSTVEKIKVLVEPAIADLGCEYLGAELFSYGNHRKLRLFIDKTSGVTVDDCAEVSHSVGAILDVEDIIPGEYRLEISSPGFDRPLFELAHYERFIGQKAKVRLRDKIDNRRNLLGIIEKVAEGKVTMDIEGHKISFELNEVGRANLVPQEDI